MLDLQLMGKRIRKHRRTNNLTVEQLAERVDVSAVFIKEIERGTKCPRLDNFVKIANALNVSADDLLCDSVNEAKDIVLNEVTSKMQSLDAKSIASLSNITNVIIKEFYNKN